ncbi:S-methyl-5'-thioadenosine phosphorylase [Haloferax sp. DFSO60]|uniref:S-methyl-5'-thioadenosine phosphorylase n=1 Tax=Haloferax sp. DFSO60 TaxID=3388652 RepID=UPI00397BC2B5
MKIGFIGGSGIYEALPLENTREEPVDTPFGEPSTTPIVGEFGDTGREVVFLPRHGPDHQHSPTTLPYRANIFALKKLGVTHILASNAVGSLKEDLPPQTLVVPDQIYDRTKHRPLTFFDEGIVVHQPFAMPYDEELVSILAEAAEEATDATVQEGGTYVCIEGPSYSTKAESEHYRAQGWDIIGMTTIPEAKLAREAEMAYATITGVTDYDVWKESSEVTLDEVLKNAAANEEAIKETVEAAIRKIPDDHETPSHSALQGTINTPDDAIPGETKEKLAPLIEKYVE